MILDTGGNRSLGQLRRALTPRGTLVIVGSETGGRWLGGSDRQLRALMLSRFAGQTLTTLLCSENAKDLRTLAALIQSGQAEAGHRPDLPAVPRPPRPSSTCKTATPAARSSSPSQAPTTAETTPNETGSRVR